MTQEPSRVEIFFKIKILLSLSFAFLRESEGDLHNYCEAAWWDLVAVGPGQLFWL